MRKRHLIPIAFVSCICACLLYATSIVNRGEGNEGSGFVQIESRLVNGGFESTSVSNDNYQVNNTLINLNPTSEQNYLNVAGVGICYDSSEIRWTSDTMIITEIIRDNGPDATADLSGLKFDYVATTTNGPLILAQNNMVGIYLIQKPGCDEMLFMNYFDRAVQVDFQEAKHKGMPDIITTNYDMSLSFYVWDGAKYILDHEGKWDCPA